MNRRTPARVHTHAQAGTRWGRKALSLLLSLALCLSLLPTVAFAEGASGGSAEIQLGTGGIQTNDVVYYGVYTEDGTSYEVPWYALDTNGFLLSKYTIGTSIFRNRDDFGYYNYSTERECEDSSVLKKTMDGLYNGAGTTLFLDLEQGAIKKTTLTGESMHDSSTPSVQAHLFPLSLSEAWSIEKSQWKAQEITDPEGKGQGWWIRTSNVDNLANFMYSMYYSNTYIHVSKAVRPAFNLNLDAVLFTSAAVGGKNGTNIGLKKVDDNNGNEWKLTLKDSSRQFAVTETTASCKPGDTITLNYTGATIKTDDAPNEYISAMIADSSGVQYYGKIAQPTNEAGEIRITIPFSLTAGTYTLYVFSEQCNGDERTDYASDLKGIPLTVNNTPRPSDGDTPAIILGTSSLGTGDIVYFGTYGATDVPWYMLNNYGFMLSKYTLGTSDFRGNSSYYGPQAANGYYNYSTSSNEVISSVLKKTMDGLYNGTDTTLFSDLEQGAIKETTLTKESMYADDDRVTDVNAHLFPLSKAEAEVLDSEVRQARSIADPKGEARWWLRSSYSEGSAYFVSAGGGIDHVPLAIIALGVRPAFNLDMNSVLFASAAVDGKADTTVDGNLTEVSAYSDPEWKLTLRDSSRNEFTSSTTARSGNTLTVKYENATTGDNEYISAIVMDADGNVSHYGRIAQLDGTTNGASGTVSITLPTGFDKETDTLFVFNEQYNGDKKTDYASNFCTMEVQNVPIGDCTITFNGNGGTGNMGPVTVEAGSNYILPACEFTAPDNQEFQAWEIDGKKYAVGDSYIVNADTEIKALWKDSVITPTTYTVTVTTDGNGTASASPSTAEENTEITLSATPNNGYHFKEWQVINGGVTIADNKFAMPAGNVEIKAIFEADAPLTTEYTITFDANGGSGEMSAVTGVSGSYTLPECEFTAPEGKQFKGWAASAGGTVISGTSINVTADTTLYAIWENIPATEYGITVTDGKATVGAGTEISKAAEGTTVTLTANAAPAGQVFDKWGVESGSITLADENSATTTFTMPASAVSVKATYKNASHTHTFDQEIVKPEALKTAADCTHDAVYYKSCSCGAISTDAAATFTDTDSALGHAWPEEGSWSKDADKHWYECSRCHEKKDDATHDFGEDDICDTCNYDKSVPHTHNLTLVPATPATCTTPGNKAYYTCDGCDKWFEDATGSVEITDKTSVIIKAEGHTPSDWKSDADNHWKECTVVGCGVVINGSTAAHTASDWITDTAATATTDGTKHKECTVCHRVLETGTIPATGGGEHTHSYGSEWESDADKHWHECSCGAKAEEAAHTASDWITDTAATATTDGTKHKECTVCKRVLETGTIPATGGGEHTHNYSSDWKSDSINHWKECSCGHKDDVAAHSFKWVIDKEATATKKGSKHEECKFCGYQRPTVEIPATGSTTKPTNPTESNPNTGALDDVPQTGDNSSMILWIVLLIASGLGVTGTVVYSKRKKYAK